MLEDLNTMHGVVAPITYASHVTPFMQNMNQVIKIYVHASMALNIKHTLLAYFPAACTITMSHVPCVAWSSVLHNWWYLVATCVPRDGHANTKDIWWQNITVIIVPCILAWMQIPTTPGEPTQIITVLCFISLKEIVAHFPANLILRD
jgi:hypothetical protein